jgi:hypothetical protein
MGRSGFSLLGKGEEPLFSREAAKDAEFTFLEILAS